jgi:hypothetical protein
MLVILTAKLEQCEYLDPQAISNALYGLHAFGNLKEVVYPIIELLAERIQCSTETFKPQAISNSFFGLQSMENSPTARRILAALTAKLEQCNGNLSATHIGNMLYNARALCSSEEIHRFLSIMKFRIKDCTDTFEEDDIAHAFLGLSTLGGYAEARDIFQVLTPHVEACKTLNAQDISICLSAFKALHRVDEIRPLLKALASKVKSCEDKMLQHHLRKALNGVRQFGDAEEVRLIFRCLAEKAHEDGVDIAGTLLHKFLRQSKGQA